MKHTIILRAAKDTMGGWLSFENIRYKGNDYLITKDLKPVLKTEKLPSDEPLMLRVTPDKTWSINYDDDVNFKDSKNEERKKCAEIIPYHHQMRDIEGHTYFFEKKAQSTNPNAGLGVIFEYEDMAANHVRNVKIVKMMGAAYNKVNDMSYQDKLDLMYFYGENPVNSEGNMKHSEVYMRLVEPSFGIVYKRTMFGQTSKTYLDHFVNEYNTGDESYKLKISILKAQHIKGGDGSPLIKKEGAAWMFGTEVIGSNVEEAISWFMNHEKLKVFLLGEVAKSDTTNDDDMDEVLTKYDRPTDASLALKMKHDYEELKMYAISLRIPLPGVPTIPSIKEKIAQAEPIWEMARQLNIADEILAQPKLRIDKIEELVKEREIYLRKQSRKVEVA